MNSSYLNMAAGAFLGTCFVAMSLSIVSGAIYSSPNPEKPGFAIKAAEGPAPGASGPAKAEVPPIAPLLAKADVKQGEQIFKKCQACHNGDKGGPNKIGPNLWGVVGRPIASHPGFSYSAAIKKFSEDSKKHWTYEELNHFVHGPQEYVPGTAMSFAGVKKDQDRADVIAYLHTLSDDPVPFPKPEEAKPADAKPTDAKGADGKGADAGKAPAAGEPAPAQGAAAQNPNATTSGSPAPAAKVTSEPGQPATQAPATTEAPAAKTAPAPAPAPAPGGTAQ